MRTSKWYKKLAILAKAHGFAETGGFGVANELKREDGFTILIYRDGGFHIQFPDGHGGSCKAGSTKSPCDALYRIIVSQEVAPKRSLAFDIAKGLNTGK